MTVAVETDNNTTTITTTESNNNDNNKRPEIFKNAIHEISFLFTIIMALILTQAALGNVIIPLSLIGEDLEVTASGQLTWFASAFSLTTGAMLLVTGRFGDVFGHYRLLMIGYVIIGITSLVAGFATYVGGRIFFTILRALQGVGTATVMPNSVALLARAYPPSTRKSLVFALFGVASPWGFTIGAIFGAIFSQFVWWPWEQWVLSIVSFFLAFFTFFVVPLGVRPAVSKEGSIDYAGSILGVGGLVAVVYAFNEGPITGWEEPKVYILLIIGVLLLAAFVFVETKVKDPILPSLLWFTPSFPGVIACIALGWSSFGIWVFYLVRVFQAIRGASPIETGAMLIPQMVAGFCAAMVVWKLYGRLSGKLLMIIAMCCFCIGCILLAFVPGDQTYWGMTFISLLFIPFGMEISFPAASLIFSNALTEEMQGVAASMINTVINLAIALGLGMAGTIESKHNDGGNDLLKGFRSACYLSVGLSGLGIIVAFLFCNSKKDSSSGQKVEMDEKVKVEMNDEKV